MAAPRIVIIGAGLGGLSAACHLAGTGHDVCVIERDDVPGGRAGCLELGGYSFDTGPTVLTMTDILAEVFAAAGSSIDDHLTLRRLDPAYRATFVDGSAIAVRAGEAAMTEEIREQCGPAEAAAFGRFCAWLHELYEAERDPFIDRNFDRVSDLARPVSAGLRLVRLGGFGRLGPRIASFFEDDRLRRLFSFQSLYAGLAPHRALALYAVITYMDTVAGVWSVAGGMASVPRGLAAAAEKAGATFRYGEAVERIVLADGDRGPVRGVRLVGGEVVPADVVVANADIAATYQHLLPGLTAPRAVRKGTWSPSAVVWHAGVRGTLPEGTVHHNIHFGEAWTSAFDDLARGQLIRDPSTLVSVPSLSDPSMAPAGRHVLYALEPVPNLAGRLDWHECRDTVRDRLRARLAAAGYPIEAEVETFVDPTDWAAQGLTQGTPFSLAHRFSQTGPFRPANVERRAPGVVLVGGGTTPGIGVPMVLLSGKLAAARVEELASR